MQILMFALHLLVAPTCTTVGPQPTLLPSGYFWKTTGNLSYKLTVYFFLISPSILFTDEYSWEVLEGSASPLPSVRRLLLKVYL